MTWMGIHNLSKKIGEKTILKNIDLELKGGKMIALLGPNGAGKSTLFRCISGLAQIDAGEILIDANNPEKDAVYVFEQPVLYENLTAREHLRFVKDVNDLKETEEEWWIERFGIAEFADKKIMDCSLGMKKRIQLMCAMVIKPSILLLDEYVSGLDPVSLKIIQEILREYAQKGNMILLATHILSVAESVCDAVIFMQDGEVVQQVENMNWLKNKYSSLEDYYFAMVKENLQKGDGRKNVVQKDDKECDFKPIL